MKFGINITTYNRFDYARTMLESLKKTVFLNKTVIRITDDASTETSLINYLSSYIIEDPNVTLKKLFNTNNLGSKRNYQHSLLGFEEEDVDFIVNLDSDCILNKDWLLKNKEVIEKFGKNILSSSFCCRYHHGNPSNKMVPLEDNFYERDTLNGLGICFSKEILSEFKKESHMHFDSYLNLELKPKHNLRCICTKDSYIQHIGIRGENSHPGSVDLSDNFVGE